MEVVLESGAEDIEVEEDGSIVITTTWEELSAVNQSLRESGFDAAHSEVTMLASNTIECDSELGAKVIKLIEALEDLDDSQEVFSNAIIPEESYG